MRYHNMREKKINLWRRFINFFLSLFRLRHNAGKKNVLIEGEASVDLEKTALLNDTTVLTVAASVQSSPGAELLSSSSVTFPFFQDSIAPSTTSGAQDITFENGKKDISLSLEVSEAEENSVDIYDFAGKSDIELLKHLLSGSFNLPEEVQEIILDRMYLAEDSTQTEDSKQAANEEDPLLSRLKTIPLAVYAQLYKENQVAKENTESMPDNSPRNR